MSEDAEKPGSSHFRKRRDSGLTLSTYDLERLFNVPEVDEDEIVRCTSCCGIAVTLICLTAFVCTGAFVQLMKSEIDIFELMVMRMSVVAFVMFAFLCCSKDADIGPPIGEGFWFLGVAVANTAMVVLFYKSATLVPLGNTLAVCYTTYLGLRLIVKKMILREELTLVPVISWIVCVTGIIFIEYPTFLLGKTQMDANITKACENKTGFYYNGLACVNVPQNPLLSLLSLYPPVRKLNTESLGVALSGLAGVCETIQWVIFSRHLQRVNTTVMGFWTGVVGTILCLLAMITFEHAKIPKTPFGIAILVAFLLCTLVYKVPIIQAVQLLNGNLRLVIRTLPIALGFLLQYTVLHGVMLANGTWVEIIGVIMIILGAVTVPLFQFHINRREDDSPEESTRHLK